MIDTAVSQALAEIVAELGALAPQHEGLRDYARLDLSAATLKEVKISLELYDKRVAALKDARRVLEALVNDGYPPLVPRDISPAALRDLQNNAATIAAALKQFVSNEAAALRLAQGATEEK